MDSGSLAGKMTDSGHPPGQPTEDAEEKAREKPPQVDQTLRMIPTHQGSTPPAPIDATMRLPAHPVAHPPAASPPAGPLPHTPDPMAVDATLRLPVSPRPAAPPPVAPAAPAWAPQTPPAAPHPPPPAAPPVQSYNVDETMRMIPIPKIPPVEAPPVAPAAPAAGLGVRHIGKYIVKGELGRGGSRLQSPEFSKTAECGPAREDSVDVVHTDVDEAGDTQKQRQCLGDQPERVGRARPVHKSHA